MAARLLVPKLKGRTVWMVNSTAQGGGVAEMMPRLVGMLRDVGVKTEWLVMGSKDPAFFESDQAHPQPDPRFRPPRFHAREKAIYRAASREAAVALADLVDPEDILVVHDPQPLGAGAELKRRTGIRTIWRCHIGLDRRTQATEAAWEFLRPHAQTYDHAVFSAAEYIPPYLAGKASVIHPAIDPLSHKNRELSAHKLVGILCNAGLMKSLHPVLTPDWEHRVLRLHPDGRFLPTHDGDGVGLMFRPVVTQVSRWDRLKGWMPLLEGFLRLKRRYRGKKGASGRRRHRIEIARLVLAGPDPSAIQDDPEGREVLASLCRVLLRVEARGAGERCPALPADGIRQTESSHGQRDPALLHGGGPKLAAGGVRPDGDRGHVEAGAGAGLVGLRPAPANPGQDRRPPDRQSAGSR